MDVQQLLDSLRFWAQAVGDAKRTVYCQPADYDRVTAAVDGHQLGHLLTVRSSPCVPDGQILVVDEPALEAAQRETAQRWARHPFE